LNRILTIIIILQSSGNQISCHEILNIETNNRGMSPVMTNQSCIPAQTSRPRNTTWLSTQACHYSLNIKLIKAFASGIRSVKDVQKKTINNSRKPTTVFNNNFNKDWFDSLYLILILILILNILIFNIKY
jgi:hypothetical protein